jgi:hypothetical protein
MMWIGLAVAKQPDPMNLADSLARPGLPFQSALATVFGQEPNFLPAYYLQSSTAFPK